MFPSHLLGALLLGALISWARPLKPHEWLLALGFGVAIDLDHALQFPVYVASHGMAGLTPASMLTWGGAWQGFMHTPWALALVVPACMTYRTWVPAAFWLLHMFQDFVVARHYVAFGSATEWGIVLALLALVAALFVAEHRSHGAVAPFGRHVGARLGFDRVAARFRPRPREA